MAKYNILNTDFSGGLMSPYLRGRTDIDKYVKGAQRMENFLPLIQGPAKFREGFQWVAPSPSGNVQLLEFSINDQNRFVLLLSAHQIQVYDTTTQILLYTRGDGTASSIVPYTDEQVPDVRVTKEVESMILVHPEHPPYSITANTLYEAVQLFSTEADTSNFALLSNDGFTLFSGSVGSGSLVPWDFQLVEFTSHPFKQPDVSGNILRIEEPVEVVRLESTNVSDFSFSATELGNMHEAANAQYVEYLVANQWALARVLTTTENDEGVAAPENPTGTSCYVDPVDSVVNVKDLSVRLAAIEGSEANAPWTVADGVPDGDTHVRADVLIFETSHINSWIRVGGDKLFTNVARPDEDGAYNSQDGNIRWGRITDIRGVEDHPVDFVYDTLDNGEYSNGSVYDVYEFGSAPSVIHIMDGSGNAIDDRSAVVSTGGAPTRFTMHTKFRVNGTVDSMTGTSDVVEPSSYPGLTVADLSNQRQFDVVKVEDVKVEGTGFRTTVGTVSAFDLVTDKTGQASHSTTLLASRDTFSSIRDVGRYVLGALGDSQVLLQIAEVVNSQTATVDVLSSVPVDPTTGDILNNGVFEEFRLGAWYTGNWPSTVSFYEQRRVFAGTQADPNLVWFSKTKDSYDFRVVEDDGLVLDTTGITYPLGTSSTTIRWLASGPTLIAGTEANEWQLRPNEFSAAITPENIRITQETAIGSKVQGERVGSSVFFPHIGGKEFMEFRYDFQTQQFVTSTTTKLANTLFEDDPIISFSYQTTPHAAFWLVTQSGRLITLTYRKEDDFFAWAEHPSEGTYVDVVVVPKGDQVINEDQVWVVTDRGGERHLEVLSPWFVDSGEDNLKPNLRFLDSYIRFPATGYEAQSSIPVPTRFSSTVPTVVDGVYLGELPVENSQVVLPEGVSVEYYALIGFRYEGAIQGMPQAWSVSDGNSYGREKRLLSVRPYVYKSMGFDIGFPDSTGVVPDSALEHVRIENGIAQPMGESPALYTGFTRDVVPLGSNFGVDEVPVFKQTEPYPLNLVSVVYKSEL